MQRAKQAWARVIRKVYEADTLECPKCKGAMRVIALIDDRGAPDPRAPRPLQPEALARAPPMQPEAWPAHLALTYHPVPDIMQNPVCTARSTAGTKPKPVLSLVEGCE